MPHAVCHVRVVWWYGFVVHEILFFFTPMVREGTSREAEDGWAWVGTNGTKNVYSGETSENFALLKEKPRCYSFLACSCTACCTLPPKHLS